MKNNHLSKAISFAYPSSKIARDLGFGESGCFYVQQTLRNIEGSDQYRIFPAQNCEGYRDPDDKDLISFFNECEGEICRFFLKYGNSAALSAIAGS